MNTSIEKYPAALRVLHWLMALLIIVLLVMGLAMDEIPRGDPMRATVYNLHKSLGVTVLALALLRLTLRLRLSVPALPDAIPARERLLAALGHKTLYLLMIILPISGLVMSNSYGFTVSWFGLPLPLIIGMDKDRGHMAGEAHEFIAFTLMGLIALHVLGAAKHYIKERINLFKRMM